eukprot:9769357-Heterocapsa_arctica.AAC.1
MKAWISSNYPDRDNINRERTQEEPRRHEEDMAAQTDDKQQDEHVEGLESKMMADDVQKICSHKLSESNGSWITNMNDKMLGEL